MVKLICLVLVLWFSVVSCNRHLPDYVKACKRDDPKIRECATKSARDAMSHIIKGDKSLKLQSFLSYHLKEANVTTGANLKLTLRDIELTGVDTVDIQSIDVDFEKSTINCIAKADKITVTGTYTMDGRILVLPITGSGAANLTYINTTFDFELIYEIFTKDDGGEFARTKEMKLVIEPEVVLYNFENLFNGNKRLGDEMNKFLNENHKEIGKDLNPEFAKVVAAVVANTIDTIIDDVPYDEILV